MFHDFPKNLLEFSTEVAQKNAGNFHNCESIKRKAALYQEEIMVQLSKIILTIEESAYEIAEQRIVQVKHNMDID